MVVAKMTTRPLTWATDGSGEATEEGKLCQKFGFRGEDKFSVGHIQFEVL